MSAPRDNEARLGQFSSSNNDASRVFHFASLAASFFPVEIRKKRNQGASLSKVSEPRYQAELMRRRKAQDRMITMKISSFLSLFFLSFSFLLSAEEKESGLSIELLSENKVIAVGEPFTVGLRIQHEPEFHTYWRNPGIVGIPTSLEWELPPGYTASDISWPYPEQCTMAGHPCHGFERDVLLLITITPPLSPTPTEALTLKVSATWMCCAQTCHPGSKELSLNIPIASTSHKNSSLALLFQKARQELPKESEAWQLTSSARTVEGQITLKFKGPSKEKPLYFFSSDGLLSSNQSQSFVADKEGGWALSLQQSELAPAEMETMAGVLHSSSGYYALSSHLTTSVSD